MTQSCVTAKFLQLSQFVINKNRTGKWMCANIQYNSTVHNRWFQNPHRHMCHVRCSTQSKIHGDFLQSQYNLNQ